jgi:mRNA interferase HigB
MHIITKKALQTFWEIHPEAESSLRNWFTRVSQAQWNNFAELRRDYPSADLVGRFTVFNTVFNIGGNHYRLIGRIAYRLKRVYIRLYLYQ